MLGGGVGGEIRGRGVHPRPRKPSAAARKSSFPG